MTPSVFNAINTVLNDKNAQYAIMRTTPKVFTVPRGQQSQHIDNVFLGEIPKRIAVCMMDNDSYNGNYKKNPSNFKHYNLTQIGISVNGEEVPFKPLKLDFDEKLFVTTYDTILRYGKTSLKQWKHYEESRLFRGIHDHRCRPDTI